MQIYGQMVKFLKSELLEPITTKYLAKLANIATFLFDRTIRIMVKLWTRWSNAIYPKFYEKQVMNMTHLTMPKEAH